MKTPHSIFRRIGIVFPIILGFWTNGVHAQPGMRDAGFSASAVTGKIGFSVAVQPDGNVIAAGTFGVMRFLPDGTVDPAFQSIPAGPTPFAGTGYGVGAVALQRDGRILVSGTFTNEAGESLPALMRLLADGSLDPSFSLDSRAFPNGQVLAVQPDGKVLSSGFYYHQGEDAGSLIRLRSDGTLDPDWDARWYNNSADMFSLTVGPGGQIYFTSFAGIFGANPDGSRNELFNPELDTGPWGAIALQHDGKLIVGQYSDGSGYKSVRRLLPDGTDDPDWSVPGVVGGDAVVFALLVQPDGKVLVGGNNLTSFDGMPTAGLGRLNLDGSVDTTFNTRGDLFYYDASDMALAPDGKVIVAGRQLLWPDVSAAPGIWRLNNDTGMQPQLKISFAQNQRIILELSGQQGATYRLEFREQLPVAGAWTSLTDLTLSGGSATWEDTGATSSTSRFYRAVSVQ